jgi:hypothetical protein
VFPISDGRPESRKRVVLCGDFGPASIPWEKLSEEFGLDFSFVNDPAQLQSIEGAGDVVSLFIDLDHLERHLAQIGQTDSTRSARLVVCHSLSSRLPDEARRDSGAFHTLPVPFNEGELRQSLSFLSAALEREKKSEKSSENSSLPAPLK